MPKSLWVWFPSFGPCVAGNTGTFPCPDRSRGIWCLHISVNLEMHFPKKLYQSSPKEPADGRDWNECLCVQIKPSHLCLWPSVGSGRAEDTYCPKFSKHEFFSLPYFLESAWCFLTLNVLETASSYKSWVGLHPIFHVLVRGYGSVILQCVDMAGELQCVHIAGGTSGKGAWED